VLTSRAKNKEVDAQKIGQPGPGRTGEIGPVLTGRVCLADLLKLFLARVRALLGWSRPGMKRPVMLARAGFPGCKTDGCALLAKLGYAKGRVVALRPRPFQFLLQAVRQTGRSIHPANLPNRSFLVAHCFEELMAG
jgi:hypothetical protein